MIEIKINDESKSFRKGKFEVIIDIDGTMAEPFASRVEGGIHIVRGYGATPELALSDAYETVGREAIFRKKDGGS